MMDYVDGHTKNIKTFEATYLDISLVCRAKKKNKNISAESNIL